MMNPFNLLKNTQALKEQSEKLQQELLAIRAEGNAGGRMVSGQHHEHCPTGAGDPGRPGAPRYWAHRTRHQRCRGGLSSKRLLGRLPHRHCRTEKRRGILPDERRAQTPGCSGSSLENRRSGAVGRLLRVKSPVPADAAKKPQTAGGRLSSAGLCHRRRGDALPLWPPAAHRLRDARGGRRSPGAALRPGA